MILGRVYKKRGRLGQERACIPESVEKCEISPLEAGVQDSCLTSTRFFSLVRLVEGLAYKVRVGPLSTRMGRSRAREGAHRPRAAPAACSGPGARLRARRGVGRPPPPAPGVPRARRILHKLGAFGTARRPRHRHSGGAPCGRGSGVPRVGYGKGLGPVAVRCGALPGRGGLKTPSLVCVCWG